ncbi:MAG TPA: SRPBCC domain-containing protein [Terriglobales bacterium]
MDRRGDTETAPLNNIGAVTINTPGDRQIVVTRLFDAPRALVFEAWTKAEHVAQWWDPSGVPLAVCEIDLRPGGAFRWVNRAPDGGEGHAFAGIYRQIVPPEKLVFTAPESLERGATLVFTEEGKKTRLTMTIECGTRQERDAMLQMRVDAGTAQTLENLAAYLPTIA